MADDDIRGTVDALAERLRGEISRQLDEFSGPLAASIDQERADRCAEAATQAERLADVERRLAAAVADADNLLADAERRLAAAAAEGDDRVAAAVAEANGRHAAGLKDIDVRHAAAVAEAVADAETRARDAARMELRGMELAGSERVLNAMCAIDRARSLSEILDTLASYAGREAARVSVLLVRGSQLRAWRFIGFGPRLDETRQYEIPMTDAGLIGDAVRSGAPVSGDSAAGASAPVFAELPPGWETLAVPIVMDEQVVAVLYADQGPESPARLSWPASLEAMARHAARCLEAVIARRAAQVLLERPGQPAAPASGAFGTGAERADAGRVVPDAAASAPEGPHADDQQAAHRYARLLVSEIKLYHEADVLAGRRERDLASRLGGEIARARVLYEQRVSAHIRQSADYFHEELVRTLADGDGALIA